MTTIVTRLFDTYEHASMAVTELESFGIPHSAISLVANNVDDRYSNVVPKDHSSSAGAAAGTGASLGTVIGGGAGLLAGLGMLAIPGVGPVVAAGWLIATAVGAGVGAASGGIIGSLVGAGVSETDAHVYAEGVRRGGTLVTAKVDDAQAGTAERILDKHGAVDTVARGDAYRAEGWSRFDEDAPAYRAGASADLGRPERGTPVL
jgi:hypothetical protein